MTHNLTKMLFRGIHETCRKRIGGGVSHVYFDNAEDVFKAVERADGAYRQLLCFECGVPLLGEAAAVIASALVDVLPPAGAWPLIGETFSTMALLCCSCVPRLLSRPEALSRRLRHTVTGAYHHEVYTLEGGMRPLIPVKPRKQPIGPRSFFEGRAASLRKLVFDSEGLLRYCTQMEQQARLRVVGCFSSDCDIAAVYHFGLCLAQEGFTGGGTTTWFLNPRMNGPHRIAYLIKSRSAYVGAVAFDLLGYNTLAWAWLHPSVRRQGILSRLWHYFESAHAGFKVLLPVSAGMQEFLAAHPGHELTGLTGGLPEAAMSAL